MKLLWPWLALLFFLIPLIIGVYVWMLRRKRKYSVRFSNLALIREALPRRSRWRQHLPFILFCLGLTGLLAAVTRPVVETDVPLSRTTIILALDVSRSMCSTDVAPNRLSVAQEAALAFINELEGGTQIGIVAFAGFAEIIVPPTDNKLILEEAIVNLTTARGTAIGSATLKSIDAIAEINPAVSPSGLNLRLEDSGDNSQPEVYEPEIIVLLTDGANSQGPLPLDAAQQAADRQLRIYTIGFGTPEGGSMVCTQQQLGGDAFGDGFGRFGGGFSANFRRLLVIDEPTLRAVAETTGGDYFRAESAEQLNGVFRDLPSQIVVQKEQIEVSIIFSILGMLLSGTAVALSLLWNRYP